MEVVGTINKLYSIEEYLRLETKASSKYEFLDGKIKEMSGASPKHNLIAGRIIHTLISELDLKEELFQVLTSDTRIFIEAENSFLYPDAVVVCKEPILYKDSQIAITNPLLIVEILSDSTAEYDRSEKFLKYRHLKSFKEYVLVSQKEAKVSSFFQKEEKVWVETEAKGLNAKLYLPSLDIDLPLKSVYRNVSF